MKKYIILAACIQLFAFASGQTVVVLDTTWQENANGKFYEVRRVEYSSGEYSISRALIGDTATVFTAYLTQFEIAGNRMANAAMEARGNDKEIKGILQRRDSILAKLGRDITDTLAAKYAGPLLPIGWVVHEDTTALDVIFTINNQGQLRYQITGFPARNAFVFARTLRLQNYKATGRPLDIYAAPGGNWGSVDDRVRMRFPGNQGLNRAAPALKPQEAQPAQPAPKTTKPKKNKRQ